MFKSGSIENELMHSMEKTLVSSQIETKHNFNKLAKAFDYLNAAADIFDKAGLQKESREVEKVLRVLATQELISNAFSTDDIGKLLKHLDLLSAEDLKNLFVASPLGMAIKVTSIIYNVLKKVGQEGPFEAIKDTLVNLYEKITDEDEREAAWSEIKDDIASKFATAVKAINLAKFIV